MQICTDIHDMFVAKGIESLFLVQSLSFDTIYDGCDIIVQASKCVTPFMHEKNFGIMPVKSWY